ncbi:MAG: TRAM domain-containing protein [Candidatus Micrarchaeota archaeon]|nr:TRAM domain-containing protein [Candidatus Micrarchaeota archaeon]
MEEYKQLIEGGLYDLRISARAPQGDGMGRISNMIVYLRNNRARIGKTYKVKITSLHKDFAYAEALDNSKPFIGNGTLII